MLPSKWQHERCCFWAFKMFISPWVIMVRLCEAIIGLKCCFCYTQLFLFPFYRFDVPLLSSPEKWQDIKPDLSLKVSHSSTSCMNVHFSYSGSYIRKKLMYNANMDTVRIVPPSCRRSQVRSELVFDWFCSSHLWDPTPPLRQCHLS